MLGARRVSVIEVASTLLQYWDVVGVAEIDFSPEAEYRHEAEQIVRTLKRGASTEAVAGILTRAAANMGVRADIDRDVRAAHAITGDLF